jgi:hypothetical protein
LTSCTAHPITRPRFGRRLAFVVILAAAALLAAGCGSGTPPPSTAQSGVATASPTVNAPADASPSATTAAQSYSSQLYGYTLVVPSGWQTQPAGSPWLSGALEGRCPADWDCFSGASGEPTLAIAAAAVRAGLTLDQWRTRLTPPEGCVDSAVTTATTLGGEPAETWTTTCEAEALHSTKVVALHAGRGYIALLASPVSNGLENDRATLNSILTALRFVPS